MPLTINGSGNISSTANVVLSSAGLVYRTNRPAFLVRSGGFSSVSGDNPLIFTDVVYNIGGMYNTTNGRITAPVPGIYLIHMNLLSPASSATFDLRFWKNGSIYNGSSPIATYGGGASAYKHNSVSLPLSLEAGDWVAWYSLSGNTSSFHNDSTHNWISGCLLG